MRVKTNYISVDKKSAISSYGETWVVGDRVEHQDKEAGDAEILAFEAVEDRNEVRVHTTKGYAHIDFLESSIKLQ